MMSLSCSIRYLHGLRRHCSFELCSNRVQICQNKLDISLMKKQIWHRQDLFLLIISLLTIQNLCHHFKDFSFSRFTDFWPTWEMIFIFQAGMKTLVFLRSRHLSLDQYLSLLLFCWEHQDLLSLLFSSIWINIIIVWFMNNI